jgi:hypothetical protein
MGKTRFKQIFKGGYSRVFQLEDAPGIVCKRQEKYTEEGLVFYSTLVDAMFMSSLRPIPGTPIVTSIDQTTRHVDIYMKHHGQTLTAWMRAQPPEVRAVHAPAILRALWSILANMHYNGCMHTDLKPCNILLQSEAGAATAHPTVTLIDFNCMAVVGSHDVGLKYARSVGTWSHAPPEIVFHEQPYPQSPVWSMALIAVALYDRYPLPPRLTHDADGRWYGDRKNWRRIINQLMETNPAGMPLDGEKLAGRMGRPLFDAVRQSLRWRPDERLSLSRWHGVLFTTPLPAWHILDRNVDPTLIPADKRAAAIEMLYLLSSQCGVAHWFCHAVFLFDRCGKWLKATGAATVSAKVNAVAATCWCIVGFLNNKYVADDVDIVAKLTLYGFEVHANGAEAGLPHWAYQVAAALDYNAWVKPLDVRLHEALGSGARPTLECLRDLWTAVDRPYSLAILAAVWAADLKSQRNVSN